MTRVVYSTYCNTIIQLTLHLYVVPFASEFNRNCSPANLILTKVRFEMEEAQPQSLFRTSDHAAVYAKYRVKPPQSIFEHILTYLEQQSSPPFEQALDIGCGNGQSTELLAEHFKKVTGLDISDAQIDEARKRNKYENISFQVGTETNLPFENGQLQLITASQCHILLDLPAFYKEAKRVLVPSQGVLCIYFYQIPSLIGNQSLEQILKHIEYVEMAEFWDKRLQKMDEGLDFVFPFDDVVKEQFTMDFVVTVSDVCGFVRSLSPYPLMLVTDPERGKRVINDLQEKIFAAIGSENRNPDMVTVTMRYSYNLIMGRNKC